MAAAVPLVFGALGAWAAPAGYAALGFSIGSAIGSMLVPGPSMEGPRMGDLSVQASTYGQAIAKAYGTVRVSGNMIWTAGIREVASEEGGKGGPSYTSYSYFSSWAIALCEGEIIGVKRIWFDSDLVYDVSPTASAESLAASYDFQEKISIYLGSHTQTADPLIEASEGAGNVPAYRGTAYIVFDDHNIDKYGRIPNVSVEIDAGGYIERQDGKTVLLMHFDGADGQTTTEDELGHIVELKHIATPYKAELDTSSKKFGLSSLYLEDFGYLEITESENLKFANDDFLIEYYFRQEQVIFNQFHLVKSASPQATVIDGWRIRWDNTGSISFTCGDGVTAVSVACEFSIISGEYHHIAVQRSGGYLMLYMDGVLMKTALIDLIIGGDGQNIIFGHNYYLPTYYFYDGRIDDLRIVKGLSIYNGESFTVPDEPFYHLIPEPPSGEVYVADIVDHICGRAISSGSVDVNEITYYTINGYSIGRQMTARAALKPLQDAYLFDIVEDGGELVCVKRGGASVAAIPEDDLQAAEPGQSVEPFSIRRAQDAELPRKLNVSYYDFDRDHQQNVQAASRLATESVSDVDLSIPIVTDADHMALVAEVLLYTAWRERESAGFSLPAETYYTLAPADVVTVTYGSEAHRLRLTKLDYSAPGLIRCEAAFDDAEIYTSSATGVAGSIASQTVTALGATVGAWLDLPLLLDSHDPNGVYAAIGSDGTKWHGGALLVSVDGGTEYTTAATFPVQCVVGTCSTTLSAGPVNTLDRANTVRVVLANADHALASCTEAQALDGVNTCAIGAEVVSFTTATLVTAGTYDLSGLVRGRRGTDGAAAGHGASERFVLLDTKIRRIALPSSKIGAKVHYKFVQAGEIAADIAGTQVTYAANAFRPYAVCHLTATDAGGGDWDIAWTRRNRLDGEWRDYVDVPMSEASEAYRVQVYTGATQNSSTDVTTTTATVAASSGDVVKVYQLSATTGPGAVSEVTIP